MHACVQAVTDLPRVDIGPAPAGSEVQPSLPGDSSVNVVEEQDINSDDDNGRVRNGAARSNLHCCLQRGNGKLTAPVTVV